MNEDSLRKYFLEYHDSLNPLEGIWEVSATTEIYHFDTLYNVNTSAGRYRLAIVIENGKARIHNLSKDSLSMVFLLTDVKGVYLYKNFYSQINQYSKPHAVICKSDEMEYTFDTPAELLKLTNGNEFIEGLREVNVMVWKKTQPQIK